MKLQNSLRNKISQSNRNLTLSALSLGLIAIALFVGASQVSERTPSSADGPQAEFDSVVWNPSQTKLEDHVKASKTRILTRMGISENVVHQAEDYFFQIRQGQSLNSKKVASECVNQLDDHTQARDKFFLCLLASHPDTLNAELFDKIHSLKIERIQSVEPDFEKEKTIALIAYLEDLIRERLNLAGQKASWFSTETHDFLDAEEFADFPFEDGDILLSMGTSWISSMITQSTFPQKKYSHAYMVRVDSQGFRTMEAIIEKGVISNDFDYFSNEELNGVLVLRWKNKSARPAVARRAAIIAEKWVTDKVGYDIEMNVQDPSKLFCSELVLRAYAEASGLEINELTPKFAQIRSSKVFELLKLVGVGKREMPSPGDLMASTHLEIVGSWRPQKRLLQLWNMIFMADVFIERLELNYEVKPALGRLAGWMMVAIDGIYGLGATVVGSDRNLIPEATSKKSLKYLVTIQKGIFDPAIEDGLKLARKNSIIKEASLLSVAPWDMRGYISYATQNDATVRSVLYDPKHPPRSGTDRRRGRPRHRRF